MKGVSDFFGKIKKWAADHKTIIAVFIAIAFVLVHLPLVMSHEVSDDEGIVWGLSKEINLTNIYEINSIEPHPLLWEIILAPFSQNGFSIMAMNYIALFFVALAIFLFVRFAPFGYISKLIFILSSAFFYFIPVIAGDYSLIPLAICLVCLAYKKRHERPLLYGLSLAFLAQTHFLMYGLLAALFVGFVIEETLKKKKLGKMLLSILFVALPVGLSVLSTVPQVIGSLNNHAILADDPVISSSTEHTDDLYRNTIEAYFGVFTDVLSWVVIVYIAILAISIFSENTKIGIYSVVAIGFWFYVLENFYKDFFIFGRKVAIIPQILLIIVWLLYIEGKKNQKNILSKLFSRIEIIKYLRAKVKVPAVLLVYLLVLCSIPHAFASAKKDIEYKYANSNDIAAFINKNIEEGALVIEGDNATSYSFNIATYGQIEKDVEFYNIPLDSFNDYVMKIKYSNENAEKYAAFRRGSTEDLKELFDSATEKYEHVYYITVVVKDCKDSDHVYHEELLDTEYENIATLNQEEYIEQARPKLRVYKIK